MMVLIAVVLMLLGLWMVAHSARPKKNKEPVSLRFYYHCTECHERGSGVGSWSEVRCACPTRANMKFGRTPGMAFGTQ